MSAWIGEKDNRLERIKRLSTSGLPVYDYHFCTVGDKHILNEMYNKYNKHIVMRVFVGVARYTFIDYHPDKLNIFDNSCLVIVNVYDPAKYCGAIIKPKSGEVTIEMTQDSNLEALSHGEIVPYNGQLINGVMRYTIDTPIKVRCLMWSVIRSLKQRIGYYEFCISDKLRFLDIKE